MFERGQVEKPNGVLVGPFAPPQFSLDWLVAHGLVADEPRSAEAVKVVSPRFTDLMLSHPTGPLHLQVTTERVVVMGATRDAGLAVRDLLIGILGLLPTTPVTSLGVNLIQEFTCDSVEQWHRIGHTLAPKALWGFGYSRPGLEGMAMEVHHPSHRSERIVVKLEKAQEQAHGLTLNFNEHFERATPPTDSEFALSVLREHWDTAQAEFVAFSAKLLSAAARES